MAQILIVDDNEQNLYLGKVLFESHGHGVTCARSGTEALELAHARAFDVVITDVLMPDMDGFSLCRKWRQDASLTGIPLVFYTATYTADSDMDFGLSLGAARFIRKPSDPDEVLKAVEEVLHTPVPPPAQVGETDQDYLRKHNEALGRKLDRKVTQLEQSEEKLRQAQRLEAMGLLASGVAHDFNNWLTAIVGNLNLALAKLPPDSPATPDLRAAEQVVQRAAELTQHLLAFSRQQERSPSVVDLHVIVEQFARVMRRALGPDVRLELSLFAKPAYVVVDGTQIEQVLMNLVVNARDAMPDGGTISIETQEELHEVRLSVVDQGIGMDAETERRLFEPFFTTKGPGKGTGLGLSTVYGIVQQSGGRLEVSSLPGAGTRFSVTLPLAPPNSRPAASKA